MVRTATWRCFTDRKHDFSSTHCSPQSEEKRLSQICVTSGHKFCRQPKHADRKDPLQRKSHNDALTNSSTQIIQGVIKIRFAQNDTPHPPQMPRTKKRNSNFEQVWLSSIYKTKIRSMDNFILICLNLITGHQGKSYLVIRWRKHTPLARQVATGRDAVHSSSRCSRNERGVPSPARSK